MLCSNLVVPDGQYFFGSHFPPRYLFFFLAIEIVLPPRPLPKKKPTTVWVDCGHLWSKETSNSWLRFTMGLFHVCLKSRCCEGLLFLFPMASKTYKQLWSFLCNNNKEKYNITFAQKAISDWSFVREELAVSYSWTSWTSRLQESYLLFYRDLLKIL